MNIDYYHWLGTVSPGTRGSETRCSKPKKRLSQSQRKREAAKKAEDQKFVGKKPKTGTVVDVGFSSEEESEATRSAANPYSKSADKTKSFKGKSLILKSPTEEVYSKTPKTPTLAAKKFTRTLDPAELRSNHASGKTLDQIDEESESSEETESTNSNEDKTSGDSSYVSFKS